MKKIFTLIIFLLVFSVGNVKAERFYEDDYITGVYAVYQDDNVYKPQQIRFIRRNVDSLSVYCLTPSDTIYEDEFYTARMNNQPYYLNISKEKYKRITEIAYFGYNYKGHTDSKWYAITQVMLWKEMEPNATVYYTDKFKGNKIEKFLLEEQEIENLIKNYHILPNINNLDLTYNKSYEIEDTNNILNEYTVENSELDIKIENNKLKINTNKKGTFKIKLIRKDGNHSHITIPYTASKGQDILIRGSIERPYKEITINVTGSTLQIKKVDSETLDTNNRGEATIVGANYNLYDENNNLVDTLVINNDGTANIENIKYGNYTLKEIKAPIGYNLDKTTYNLKIDNEQENIVLKEEIIKANLIINKYLKDDNILTKEENITFSIYDSNNILINKITTNDNGQAKIELTYGKYKIVQENTKLGYKKVDDFYIEINNNEDKIINLENERVNVSLKINKKDIDSNKNIIHSNALFKIKDLINNKYLKYNDSEVFKTNEEGIININIKGGKYNLEEIESPNGYILGENIEFIIEENTSNMLELNIYNKKQYGKIKINKKGKLLNNNFILLKDVKFNIYAYQDVRTDDDVIHYKKDELVDTVITDMNGLASSKKLLIGKYYIEEVSTLDNFIIDKNKYLIDFNNNSNIEIIIKEINITNLEKQIIKEENKIIDSKNNQLEDKINIEISKEKEEIKQQKIKEIVNIKNDIEEEIQTKYPKTSNREMYVYIIVSYLLLIGFMLLISSLKNEN